jgi:hypothetical protein
MKTILQGAVLGLAALTFTAGALFPAQSTIAGDDQRVRLRADLSGKTLASGKADYRERLRGDTLVQRFSVEVEDGEAGAQLPVYVNGVQFAVIFLNDLGFGEIQFRTASAIDDPDDGTPIDPDFPRLQAGDAIEVGKLLSGAFELD